MAAKVGKSPGPNLSDKSHQVTQLGTIHAVESHAAQNSSMKAIDEVKGEGGLRS